MGLEDDSLASYKESLGLAMDSHEAASPLIQTLNDCIQKLDFKKRRKQQVQFTRRLQREEHATMRYFRDSEHLRKLKDAFHMRRSTNRRQVRSPNEQHRGSPRYAEDLNHTGEVWRQREGLLSAGNTSVNHTAMLSDDQLAPHETGDSREGSREKRSGRSSPKKHLLIDISNRRKTLRSSNASEIRSTFPFI